MGLDHSKPLSQMSCEEVATITDKLGKQYSETAQAIRESAVDGAFLASLTDDEVQETLDDLGAQNRLHRRVLERKLVAALQEELPHPILDCTWETMEDISELHHSVSPQPKLGLRRMATSPLQRPGVRRIRRASTMQGISTNPAGCLDRSCRSQYSRKSLRPCKSFEDKEEETRKLMDLMTKAAEQQMQERYALMNKESELKHQIELCYSSTTTESTLYNGDTFGFLRSTTL